MGTELDNQFGGNTIGTVYNGTGTYQPFSTGVNSGIYTPPVTPNPLFVPPIYNQSNYGKLRIVLRSDYEATFTQDNANVGVGRNVTVDFTPSLKFGSSKTYRSTIDNKISQNYYVVSIRKKYKTSNDYYLDSPLSINVNSTNNIYNFNYNYSNTTAGNYITKNDYLYTEIVSIQEYAINRSYGSYVLLNEKTLDSTSGIVDLAFSFESKPKVSDVSNGGQKPSIPDTLINYEIAFTSNFTNELGNNINLNYQIVDSNNNIIENANLKLIDSNTDNKKIAKSILNDGSVNISITETNPLPVGYSYSEFYYTNKTTAERNPNNFSVWNKTNKSFKITGKELLSGIVVAALLEKTNQLVNPTVKIIGTQKDFEVKDSDTETEVNISFSTTNADLVEVYVDENAPIRIVASTGYVKLYFKKNFKGVYGTKRIYLVPIRVSLTNTDKEKLNKARTIAGTTNGASTLQEVLDTTLQNNPAYRNKKIGDIIEGGVETGERITTLIRFIPVNDYPSITQISAPDSIDVPSFSDLSIEYEVEYNSFSATSVDVFLLAKNKSKINLFKNLPANGVFKINLRDISKKFSQWNGNNNVTLIFKPYNKAGGSSLQGNEYEIVTKVIYPKIKLDEDIIKKAVYDTFNQTLKFIDLDKEEKYLTHLANFGNDEQIIIASWEEDNWTLSKKSVDNIGNEFVKSQDTVESVILKLYSPLPANIISNSTFWITKLMSNPLIETVILNEQDDIKCPPLKGPNFNIDVDFISGQSIGYESLDSLILSSSLSSSAQLVSTYLSKSLMDTDDLNIEYTSGSTYLWNNFVHFSSAKERVDNFVYKVQLIENYDNLINKNTTLSNDYNNSISANQELERQTSKKNQLISVFDGFEKFLYESSSLSWPYQSSTQRYASTSSTVVNWYENIIDLANEFDNSNPNFLKNNIPAYILNNDENENYLLFFSMVGQHFDNIYYHTKSIEKSRGLGYKSKDGISDRLLFDALKSFGWDAKNLAVDAKLWEYVLGLDSDGGTKFETPAKQRTYEVWRRIINNLPYLLKHKGSRKGVYALLSCYGIPSSNLSIFEFGGPEVTDNTKSKLVIDNTTSAIKFTSGSYIEIDWKNTNKNRKPDTIEFFVKPSTSGNYQIISGSNWNIRISGSANSEYGNVIFNYSGSNNISSSILPIFNQQFFGIEVSREISGSYHNFELNIRQADKERSIFQKSNSASVLITNSNWNSGSKIRLGNNFVGSVDEFRLWSTPLNKERFYEHVSFPEMVNGNHISASTDDLYFRLDFEYPKNLYQYTTLPNVDTNIYFGNGLDRNAYEEGSTSPLYSLNVSASFSASAGGFSNITSYPYQFESIDRTVVLEIPDFGASRYSTNKIRFESQYTMEGAEITGSVGVDLSVKSRATKRSFDMAPADSNRVGLFFSPTKELNIDIAKSFGGINLDNYIGDPSDRYKPNYNRLDSLRKYYFNRFDNRDIYAYINLIKLYEKSMFEDIKKMLPARVKASTGLLIEPHILERSKIQHKKPTSNSYQQDVSIHFSDTTIFHAENEQFEAFVNADLSEKFTAESYQYDGLIQSASVNRVIAESYQYDSLINTNTVFNQIAESYQQEVLINAGLAEPTIRSEVEGELVTIGQTDYEVVGFGIYAQNGYAIRTYYDKGGNLTKERIKIDLITEQKQRKIEKFNVIVNGYGDNRLGMYADLETYYETKLNIQPYSGSKTINAGTGSIVSVKKVNGYLPTHFRNTSDLTRGLENSFFKGCKNTSATTLDGTSPIETFATNPNTLRVNKAGRDSAEPILEVE